MADFKQTAKVIFGDKKNEDSRQDELEKIVEQARQSFSVQAVIKQIEQGLEDDFLIYEPPFFLSAIDAEATRRAKAENAMIKLVEKLEHDDITPPAASPINFNEWDVSELLNAPSRQDAWFDAITDMTEGFYAEFGKLPNSTQAWARLWTTPPAGYAIEPGKDRGDDCLKMPGENPLSKSAFLKRWEKYTA